MKKEGDRKICKECNIEIHVAKLRYQGEERLSWRNPDGTSHFEYLEDEKKFVHTPTVLTPLEMWQSEIEERIVRVERMNGIVRVD